MRVNASISMKKHQRAIAVSLAVALAASLAAGSSISADASVDATSKASVAEAYRNVLVPALAVPVSWNGTADSCDAGAISAEAQTATLAAVNYMRELSGLSKVTFNPTYNAKAQKAALVYTANNDLSHDIPSSWKCYSSDAAAAGERSNIAYGDGIAGPLAVLGYMEDPGAYNDVAGHRRWVLYPNAKTMGSGSTDIAQVLYVQGATSKKTKNPAWVEWPTAGYFPQQLEPNGRWSLTANAAWKWSFSKAKVSVKTASGKSLPVKVESRNDQGYGNDTIVFKVSGVKKASGAGVALYTVKVSGIKKAGSSKAVSYSYKVKMFDAARD